MGRPRATPVSPEPERGRSRVRKVPPPPAAQSDRRSENQKRRKAEPEERVADRKEIVPNNHMLSDSEIDDDGMLLAYTCLQITVLFAAVVAFRVHKQAGRASAVT